MLAVQAVMLLPFPVYPASAKHPLSAAVAVPVPVPELDGQPVQSAAPVAALKVSAEQAVNAPPSGPVYPAFATHAETAVEPVAAPVAELEGQPAHAASPVASLKSPAKQTVGVPPSGPVYPAFATHAVLTREPRLPPVAELVGQSSQAAADVSASL